MTAAFPVLAAAVFAGAAGVAYATIAATAPHWRRIARIAAGRVETGR